MNRRLEKFVLATVSLVCLAAVALAMLFSKRGHAASRWRVHFTPPAQWSVGATSEFSDLGTTNQTLLLKTYHIGPVSLAHSFSAAQ